MLTILNKTEQGWLYHQKIDDSRKVSSLPAGVYNMVEVDLGHAYVYGFDPVNVDNDPPLEVDRKATDLIKEMDQFFNKKEIFKKFGFAHKRGYLLHGPPGCGKSSTLRLLERHFVETFNGIVLLWQNNPFNNWLDALRDFEPGRPVMVVCEDIDNAIDRFEVKMLEILDGQKALNNFVLIATTNNLDVIPSRIKDRPSRIDRVVEIGLPSFEARLKYLKNIGLDTKTAENLASVSKKLSIAKLKELVIATVCFDESPQSVLTRLEGADMTVKDSSKKSLAVDLFDD
jgi:hypothetical protein